MATADQRIMPPNFSIIHRLNTVEGYDPLYLQRYAEFIAAINRNSADISPPFGFNRIIRVENFSSDLVDLLGVKYVLNISDMNVKGYKRVLTEGQTSIFENEEVLPRVFFVKDVKLASNKNDSIKLMFEKSFNPRTEAVIEENVMIDSAVGDAEIAKYSENEVVIKTKNDSPGFLVLTDSFYPTWHVKINGQEQKIYTTDYIFRGVVVPSGINEVVFRNSLL